MKLKLDKKINAKNLLVGFPGVGLVSPIATEYLINHMKVQKIGEIILDEVPPVAAVHNFSVLRPITLYYCKDKDIVLIHCVSNINGLEWKLKDLVLEICDKVKCKKVISIEGVANPNSDLKSDPKTFIYANDKNLISKDLLKNTLPLKEGIIMGVTGALMLNNDSFSHLCLFVDAHANMPDSKASAELIKKLDVLLDLDVDVNPLLKKAQELEDKFNLIAKKTQEAQKIIEDKKPDYFG